MVGIPFFGPAPHPSANLCIELISLAIFKPAAGLFILMF